MILRQYISREVITTCVATVGLLTAIVLSSWFIRYFGMAASGRLDVSVLLSLVSLQIPEFLLYILPLGFFVACMLAIGRLYVDHEMAILHSSGLGKLSLLPMLWPIIIGAVVLQFLLVGFWAPYGSRTADRILTEQASKSGFALIKPQEFVQFAGYTVYVKSLSDDKKIMNDILVHQRKAPDNPLASGKEILIFAKKAQQIQDPSGNSTIVDLTQGRRYELVAGQPMLLQAEFEDYRLSIPIKQKVADLAPKTQTFSQLFTLANPAALAEIGWRLSAPWMMLVAVLFALILAEVKPRQGRFGRLLPSVLIYAAAMVLVIAVQQQVGKGKLAVGWNAALLSLYIAGSLIVLTRYKWRSLAIRHAAKQATEGV